MTEEHPLFQDIHPEESTLISGGRTRIGFDLNSYIFILGAGVLFGNLGLTCEEIQFAWESSFLFEEIPGFSRGRRNKLRRNSQNFW